MRSINPFAFWLVLAGIGVVSVLAIALSCQHCGPGLPALSCCPCPTPSPSPAPTPTPLVIINNQISVEAAARARVIVRVVPSPTPEAGR